LGVANTFQQRAGCAQSGLSKLEQSAFFSVLVDVTAGALARGSRITVKEAALSSEASTTTLTSSDGSISALMVIRLLLGFSLKG